MNDEIREWLAGQLAPGEADALLEQGRRLRQLAATLDELPLPTVEPAGIYRVDDGVAGD